MRPKTSTALAALVFGFALCTQAIAADQVYVFEEAPSLDELRAIFIPDSGPGQARKIEILRDGAVTPPSAVAPVSAPAAAPPPALASTPHPAPAAAPQATTGQADHSASATAMPKHAPVKAAALPVPPKGDAVAFRIDFAFASDVVPPSYRPHLDRIVDLMRQEPKLALTIEGHTDAYGSAEYNLELSRRRAVSVMRYLVGHGVDSSRLVAIGKGKTAPLSDNPFDSRNRRVQFVSTGQSGT